MSYLLPLAAAGVFCFTVHTVLNYNYILAVEVNGQNVGYVANETVFDTAREDVQQRIDSVGAEEGKTWQVEPTFTLAIQGDVLDENQMVDAILPGLQPGHSEGHRPVCGRRSGGGDHRRRRSAPDAG